MASEGERFLVALLACPLSVLAQSETCAPCHRAIFDSYRQSGMARSFSRPVSELVPDPRTYYHQPSNSYFSTVFRDGRFFQRRYQLAAQAEVNVMEKQIDYIMGSGNHSRAYLHLTPAKTLVELPMAWYAEGGGTWAMNPGYDRPDHDGFRRLITYDCMFCHNAYPRIPPATGGVSAQQARYTTPLPEGIDCQRCHGPGDRHIQQASSGKGSAGIRQAILNPARLSTERQLEICLVCHLETTSFPLPNAIQRYDRGPFSFHPGEPLGDFILNFDHPVEAGRGDKFEIVNAGYRLRKSACFLKSGGKMVCTTCHNPHEAPRGEAAAAHYTAACRKCHGPALDAAITAGAHTQQQDCATCHMPKRRTEDVVHVAATDHWIQRHKPTGDLLAARAERRDSYKGPVALYYPESLPPTAENELYLAAAQVKQGSNVAEGIVMLSAAIAKHKPTRAEWYLDLAEAHEGTGDLPKAIAMYRSAIERNPKLTIAHQKLGTALRKSGSFDEAAAHVLLRATALDPGDPIAWHELGLANRNLGKLAAAVEAIRKALALDADFPEAHNNLGGILLTVRDSRAAEHEFREAIRIKPEYTDAHANLASLLSATQHHAEARSEFELALRQRPSDAATRYNYAFLLGSEGGYEDAQRELEQCLRLDPQFVDAHLLLGELLMARQTKEDARAHFLSALRLKPGSGRAHFGLAAILLAAGGEVSEAIVHLRSAVEDPETRARAEDLLRQLGQRR